MLPAQRTPLMRAQHASMFTDAVVLSAGFGCAGWMWSGLMPLLQLFQHSQLFLFVVPLVVLILKAFGTYDEGWHRPLAEEIGKLLVAVATSSALCLGSMSLQGASVWQIRTVLAEVLLGSLALLGWHLLVRLHLLGRENRKSVLIVGASEVGISLAKYLDENPHVGFDVKGFIDKRASADSSSKPDESHTLQVERRKSSPSIEFLGHLDELESIVRRHFIDEILVATPSDREFVRKAVSYAKHANVTVRVVPDLYDGLAIGAPLHPVGQFPSLCLHEFRVSRFSLFAKRVMDIVLSSIALVVLAPLMALIAVAVKCGPSQGPVFYNSMRIGKKGKTFCCHKFRTMVVGADQMKRDLQHLNEREGLLFKISNDPRITPLGKFMRKYSLDELPQFWNVLVGDMSLVGPRPPVPDEYSRYAPDYLQRLNTKPGITGMWQVHARQSNSFADYLHLDIQYVKNWNFWLDLKLLCKTVGVVLAGTGQ